jgi:hypothetical protein
MVGFYLADNASASMLMISSGTGLSIVFGKTDPCYPAGVDTNCSGSEANYAAQSPFLNKEVGSVTRSALARMLHPPVLPTSSHSREPTDDGPRAGQQQKTHGKHLLSEKAN